MIRALVMLALAPVAAAQLPSNWFGSGAALNQASKPPVAGWFSYAVLISSQAQLYSFTTHDIFLTDQRIITSSVRSGIASPVRTIGSCAGTCLVLLGLGDAGMAAGGATVGGAFSGGGIGVLKLGRTNWTLVAGGRVLSVANGGKQTVYELGFGRAW